MRVALLFLLPLFPLVVACQRAPQQDDSKKGDPAAPSPSACTAFGQSCEFSPGKLGTCVMKDNCTKDCFVCQSQH